MAVLWTDGTWTSESLVGDYRYSYPIDGVTSAKVCEADYVIARSSYASPTLGDATTLGSFVFYIVGDGPMTDLGGGMCRFTRRWATKPDDHDEYESYAYNFIGFHGAWGINVTSVTGRGRFTRTVTSRLAHRYFLLHATNGDYTTSAQLFSAESISEQRYVINGTDDEVDYLGDSPPFATASSPTRTAYEALIDTSEIVAEPARITRWMGPIWVRQTRYVVAL